MAGKVLLAMAMQYMAKTAEDGFALEHMDSSGMQHGFCRKMSCAQIHLKKAQQRFNTDGLKLFPWLEFCEDRMLISKLHIVSLTEKKHML